MNKKLACFLFFLSLVLGSTAFAGRIPANQRPSVIGPDKVTQEQLREIFERVRTQGSMVRGRRTLPLDNVTHVAANSGLTPQNVTLSIEGPNTLRVRIVERFTVDTSRLTAIVNVRTGFVSQPRRILKHNRSCSYTITVPGASALIEQKKFLSIRFGFSLRDAYRELFGPSALLKPVVK